MFKWLRGCALFPKSKRSRSFVLILFVLAKISTAIGRNLFFLDRTDTGRRLSRVEEAGGSWRFRKPLRNESRALGVFDRFRLRRNLGTWCLALGARFCVRSLGSGVYLGFRPIQSVLELEVRGDKVDQRCGQIPIEFVSCSRDC